MPWYFISFVLQRYGTIKRKSAAMARGGKRTGSGRKPLNGKRKLANFSTRITPELRAALEREAERRGHSLSQEVERLLTDSLQAPKRNKEVWGEDRNLGLAHLVNRAAQMIEGHTGESWMTNDYTFRALRSAVEELFRILATEIKPPRSTNLPEQIRQISESMHGLEGSEYIRSKTPGQSGQFFANSIWYHVMTLEMPDLTRSTNQAHRVLSNLRHMLRIKPSANKGDQS
jgi:hypothetical protein